MQEETINENLDIICAIKEQYKLSLFNISHHFNCQKIGFLLALNALFLQTLVKKQ